MRSVIALTHLHRHLSQSRAGHVACSAEESARAQLPIRTRSHDESPTIELKPRTPPHSRGMNLVSRQTRTAGNGNTTTANVRFPEPAKTGAANNGERTRKRQRGTPRWLRAAAGARGIGLPDVPEYNGRAAHLVSPSSEHCERGTRKTNTSSDTIWASQ